MKFFRDNFLLLIILALGFILRIWGIGFGLPSLFRYDEITYMEIAMRMGQYGLNPASFQHGSLLYYILFASCSFIYIFQIIIGIISSPKDFLMRNYIIDPTNLFLIARIIQALFGTLVIMATYLIGKKMFNKRIGLFGAYLVTISFINIQASHYIKEEMLTSLLLTSAFLSTVPIINKGNAGRKLKYYIISGLLVGFATSAKYLAGLGFTFIFTAHFLSNQECTGRNKIKGILSCLFTKNIAVSTLMVITGFILGEPYALLDFKNFLSGFISVLKSANLDYIYRIENQSYFSFFWGTLLKNALGLPLLLTFFISFYLLFKKELRRQAILLLSFPLFYLVFFCFTSVTVDRYFCVIVPFLSISAATVVEYAIKKTNYQKVKYFFAIFIFSLPLADVIKLERLLIAKDTRTISTEWIESTISTKSTIAIEGVAGPEKQINWAPFLKSDLPSLQEECNALKRVGSRATLLSLKIEEAKRNSSQKRFRIFKTYVLNQDFIEKHNPDFIVLNSYLDKSILSISRNELKGYVNKNYALIKEFVAWPPMKWDYHYQADFDNLRKIRIFDFKQKIIAGPEIYIYKKNDK